MPPKDPEAERWLAKKRKKNQHWQVKTYLANLRLPHREKNKDSSSYCVDVELFGLRFRFDGQTDIDDFGWDLIQIDQAKLDKDPYYFGESLMWNLIGKGYFSYIREVDLGESQRIYRRLIIDNGWGTKILEKRIELAGNQKKFTYTKLRSIELLKQSLSRVISLNPGLFDYLM